MAEPKVKKAKKTKAPAPPAAVKELEIAAEVPSADSGEARGERKEAAHAVYHAAPPSESRAARKARSSQA